MSYPQTSHSFDFYNSEAAKYIAGGVVSLNRLEAIQVAFSNFLIAVFALPIAIIWLHESLSFWSVIGGLLVLAGTIIITVSEYRQSKV